jgi:hypothetical protein
MVKKNGSVAAAVLFDRKAAGFPLRSLAQLVKMRITDNSYSSLTMKYSIKS